MLNCYKIDNTAIHIIHIFSTLVKIHLISQYELVEKQNSFEVLSVILKLEKFESRSENPSVTTNL